MSDKISEEKAVQLAAENFWKGFPIKKSLLRIFLSTR